MKTSIYIEDGVIQLVLTPQNDFEGKALTAFNEHERPEIKIMEGQFYQCQGGYWRQPSDIHNIERSLILRLNKKVEF